MNFKTIVKNFSATVTANVVSFLISAIVVLVIPKIIGVKEYSYWQLYIFYSGYAAFASLGWQDGIYLKYGGCFYDELDKRKLSTQKIYMTVSTAIILFLLMVKKICFFCGCV